MRPAQQKNATAATLLRLLKDLDPVAYPDDLLVARGQKAQYRTALDELIAKIQGTTHLFIIIIIIIIIIIRITTRIIMIIILSLLRNSFLSMN